ncbi:MAG: YitT family protein [Caldisericota bacterium]|nr:YitT family protein [Caldisericota bacterium]
MRLYGHILHIQKHIKPTKKSIVAGLLSIAGITIGSAIFAAGFNIFILPNHIAPGGFIGIAVILHYYFPFLQIGTMIIIMNVPLLIIGLKRLGWNFLFGTIAGTLLSSVFIDLFAPYLPQLQTDAILAAIYGGFLMGAGIGIIFRSFGSTGGSDLLGQIIYDFTGLPFGQAMMLIDVVIIILAGVVFRNINVSLYSIIAELVSNKTIDIVQSGLTFSKAVYIITQKPVKIKEVILNEIKRGVTEITAMGGYTGEIKKMLLIVVPHTQVSKIKKVVREADPESFVIVAELSEVIGSGFKSIKERI